MSKNCVIIIFGGLIKKTGNGNWQSGNFNRFRILAGYYLYKDLSKKNKTSLIVSGGNGVYRDIPGVPAVAKVMKQELIRLGLKNNQIIEEAKTLSTYHELVWVKKLLNKNQKIKIISNAYHLPRIKVLINYLPELSKLRNKVELVSAEKTVIKYNKKLEAKIIKALKSKQMAKIVADEKRGIKALKSNEYKFK